MMPPLKRKWKFYPMRTLFILVAIGTLSACGFVGFPGVYKIDVEQGNIVTQEMADQLKPGIWKYRDWVVQAFQEDMPFRQFVMQQLAGDEIERRSEASVIATGFLRLGAWNDEPNDPLDYQYDRLEELVHTTSSAFLGLVVMPMKVLSECFIDE